MKRSGIIITTDFIGMHKWSGVVELLELERVHFLKDMHRHKFIIKAKKTTTIKSNTEDRIIEFIDLKCKVDSYIRDHYFDQHAGCCILGNKSCEMIAEEIMDVFEFDEVEVWEDGENGAFITKDIK